MQDAPDKRDWLDHALDRVWALLTIEYLAEMAVLASATAIVWFSLAVLQE